MIGSRVRFSLGMFSRWQNYMTSIQQLSTINHTQGVSSCGCTVCVLKCWGKWPPMEVPPHGWFIVQNPLKTDDQWGTPMSCLPKTRSMGEGVIGFVLLQWKSLQRDGENIVCNEAQSSEPHLQSTGKNLVYLVQECWITQWEPLGFGSLCFQSNQFRSWWNHHNFIAFKRSLCFDFRA